MTDSQHKTNGRLSLQDFTKRILIIFAIFSIGILLLLLAKGIIHILLILFASVLFAIFLIGLSRWLSSKANLKESWSLMLVILSILVLIGGTVWIIGPSIAEQSDKLAKNLPESIAQAKAQLAQYQWGESIMDEIPKKQNLDDEIKKYSSKIFSFLSLTLGAFVDFLVFIAFSLFIASNPKLYTKGVLYLLPPHQRQRGDEVLDALRYTLFRWFSGRLFDMLILGVATGIGLWILGIPLALTLGLLTAILSFIPNIGPVIALVPPLLLALTQSQSKALYVILLFIGIQLLESYFLTPKIQKKAVSMPPVLLITAQLAFASLLGGLGLLLATPIMASIMVLVKMLYVEDTLKDFSIKVKGEKNT